MVVGFQSKSREQGAGSLLKEKKPGG